MEIIKGIEIVGKALWLKKSKTLVIADLHIGYEEALNKQGILVPRTLFKELKKDLNELLERTKPEIIVINGDLKHEFQEISEQEWRETLEILDLLLKHGKVILVKGNHDNILEPIAKKRKLKVVEFYLIDDICILHGDKVLNELGNKGIKAKDSALIIKTLIIGHEHPAVSLKEEPKVEKYKCFLLGSWKKQKLIVMPSFLPMIEGTDVSKEKLLSPYLSGNIDNFEVFIVGDKTYRFGKLGNIK
jgi:hypothetical protein